MSFIGSLEASELFAVLGFPFYASKLFGFFVLGSLVLLLGLLCFEAALGPWVGDWHGEGLSGIFYPCYGFGTAGGDSCRLGALRRGR